MALIWQQYFVKWNYKQKFCFQATLSPQCFAAEKLEESLSFPFRADRSLCRGTQSAESVSCPGLIPFLSLLIHTHTQKKTEIFFSIRLIKHMWSRSVCGSQYLWWRRSGTLAPLESDTRGIPDAPNTGGHPDKHLTWSLSNNIKFKVTTTELGVCNNNNNTEIIS